MSAAALPVTVTRHIYVTHAPPLSAPTRASQPNPVVLSYSELLKSVKAAGLLERRIGFYITVFFGLWYCS